MPKRNNAVPKRNCGDQNQEIGYASAGEKKKSHPPCMMALNVLNVAPVIMMDNGILLCPFISSGNINDR